MPVMNISFTFISIYTAVQSYEKTVQSFSFFKQVSSAHQGCIYLIKNTPYAEKKLK